MTQEEIDKAVRDHINRYRRQWYAQRSEQQKLAARIRHATTLLQREGYIVIKGKVPDGEWSQLQQQMILQAVKAAAGKAVSNEP